MIISGDEYYKNAYYKNELNLLTTNYFDWQVITNNVKNKLTNTLKFNTDYSFLTVLNEKSSFNLLTNINKTVSSYYEVDKMEEVEESLENLRTKVNNFSVKLIRGVLNKHNVSLLTSNKILNKNILFSYRLNSDNVTEKISQVEQFWGFRQKKYKKLRSFVFTQNYRFNNRSYRPIANFVNNENFNKYNLF